MSEKTMSSRTTKSPLLAAVLSIIFPGTGTLYNGDYTRGIIFIIIFAGLVTLQAKSHVQPFAGLLLAGFYFFQIVDAVHQARMINLSDDMKKVRTTSKIEPRGSIFWGILMMALGLIFLLANFEIILYEHIFDFWPVIIIVLGVKLIFDAFKRE